MKRKAMSLALIVAVVVVSVAPIGSDTVRPQAPPGAAPAANPLRIGAGGAVAMNSAGKPGLARPSARYEHDIRDMGEASSRLLRLRPVSFRYNNDPAGTIRYGLVAGEVEKVYPELVTYGADGKLATVRYSMLTAMLLNEVQKQAAREAKAARRIRGQATRIRNQARQIEKLSAELRREKEDFEQRLAAVERVVEDQDFASVPRANRALARRDDTIAAAARIGSDSALAAGSPIR